MSRKENLCWTCKKTMTKNCPKHVTPDIEKKMWRKKMYECDAYEYDGECAHCPLNEEHKKERLYDTCPYFIKPCKGFCSQENWMRGNYKLKGQE